MSSQTGPRDEADPQVPVARKDDPGRYALDGAADGELSPSAAERLHAHLERCPECAEEVERAQRMRELLRRSCRSDCAPESLRERITIEYRRVSVTIRSTTTRRP